MGRWGLATLCLLCDGAALRTGEGSWGLPLLTQCRLSFRGSNRVLGAQLPGLSSLGLSLHAPTAWMRGGPSLQSLGLNSVSHTCPEGKQPTSGKLQNQGPPRDSACTVLTVAQNAHKLSHVHTGSAAGV